MSGVGGSGVGGLNRLTSYITFVPRSRTNNEIVENRKKAYKDSHTTSHWPNKVEIKTYPWGFGPTYEKRGFKNIKSKLDDNGEIPSERLKYI